MWLASWTRASEWNITTWKFFRWEARSGIYVCECACVWNLVHICNISLYTRQEFCKCSTVSTLPITHPMVSPEGQIMSIHYDTRLLLIMYHLDVTCQSMLALLRDPLTSNEQKYPLLQGHIFKGGWRIILSREHTSSNTDQDACQGQTGKNILTKITRNLQRCLQWGAVGGMLLKVHEICYSTSF